MIIALFISYNCHYIFNCVASSWCNLFNSVHSEQIKWNKNFMCKWSFWNRSDRISAKNFVTFLYRWCPVPFFITWKRININTTLKEESSFFCNERKWVLQTIKSLSKQSRSKFCTKKITHKVYLVTSLDSLCHFENLHLSFVTANTDNFTSKLLSVYIYVAYFIHRNRAFEFNRDHVSVNADYFSFCISHQLTPLKKSAFSGQLQNHYLKSYRKSYDKMSFRFQPQTYAFFRLEEV